MQPSTNANAAGNSSTGPTMSNATDALLTPTASISFGRVWLPLAGRPPPPATGEADNLAALLADQTSPAELVSDGTTVWTALSGAEAPDHYAPIEAPT